ncbi:hypothetical protein D9M68_967140 [compost metagenome]
MELKLVATYPAATPLTAPRRLASKLFRLLHQWRQNARTRRQLAELDARQLSDIGISHSDRQEEISKPFWR